MTWLPIALNALTAVVQQWINADAVKRAEIEARALLAVRDMVADRTLADTHHDERTAALLAEINKALKQ